MYGVDDTGQVTLYLYITARLQSDPINIKYCLYGTELIKVLFKTSDLHNFRKINKNGKFK